MSLINEALKKAQRNRASGAAAAAAAAGTEANGPVIRRDQPKSAKTTLLIASGAILLVVLSMVGTTLWLNRPTSPAAETKSLPTTAPAAPANTSTPHIVVPPIKPASIPTTGTPIASGEPVAAAAEPPRPSPPIPEVGTSGVTAATPEASTLVRPAIPAGETAVREPEPKAKPDERIHQFVESIHVTGIRASGSDSKVLMNDRVYRVNDVVDLALGIRLTKVANDSLTFTDANGVTYIKYF